MALYNCKIDGDQYRITKFTNDLDVEASYLVSETECECPAGHRHGCRHRTMLPRFIHKGATNGNWFFNFEREQWIRSEPEQTLGDFENPDEFAPENLLPETTLELDHGPEAIQPSHAFSMLELAQGKSPEAEHLSKVLGEDVVAVYKDVPIIQSPTPLKRRV